VLSLNDLPGEHEHKPIARARLGDHSVDHLSDVVPLRNGLETARSLLLFVDMSDDFVSFEIIMLVSARDCR
jgi:hypothetical protein